MENLKQISAKVDAQTIEKIDAIALKSKYWKRNAIINNILTAIVDSCDYDAIMILVRYWKHNAQSLPLISIQKKQDGI